MTGLEMFLLIMVVLLLSSSIYMTLKLVKITNKSYLYYIENIKLIDSIQQMRVICAKISKNDGWMKNPDLSKLVSLANEIENLEVSKIKVNEETTSPITNAELLF